MTRMGAEQSFSAHSGPREGWGQGWGLYPVEGLGHKAVGTRSLAGPSHGRAGQTWRAPYGLAGGAQSRGDPVQPEAFLFCIIIPSCQSQNIPEKFVSCPAILGNRRGSCARGAQREGAVRRIADRTEAGGSQDVRGTQTQGQHSSWPGCVCGTRRRQWPQQ